jgi:hypothetical protein
MKAKTKNQRTTQEPQPAYDWRSGRYVVTVSDRRYSGDTAELAMQAALRGKGGAVMGNGTEGEQC